MTLKDTITDDATGVFLNNDEFSESVTYYPRQTGITATRSPRSIKAVVIRQSLQTLDTAQNEVVVPVFEVHVANDVVYGITGAELDIGGDMIEFPPRDGEPVKKRRIVSLQQQDHAMLVLEVQ